MRRTEYVLIAVPAVFLSHLALAGQIYGTIWEDGHPVAQGQKVTITCPNAAPQGAETDQFGAYKISAPTSGRCSLGIRGYTIDISSYKNPVRYDLEIVKEGAQAKLLRR